MNRLPRILDLAATSAGWGFYLCARKEARSGRGGSFVALLLQDSSGQIAGKIFQDVDALGEEFDSGEFVKVLGKANVYHQRVELVIDKIRRVQPDRDRLEGFREEDCIPCAPRPIEEMWAELMGLVDREATDPWVRALLSRVIEDHREKLRVWPAAQFVHHAYRGGLLEHILQIAKISVWLGRAYGADASLVLAGALLHDIGKLEELQYDCVTQYSASGNLVGHITLGAQLVRRAIDRIEGFPPELGSRSSIWCCHTMARRNSARRSSR